MVVRQTETKLPFCVSVQLHIPLILLGMTWPQLPLAVSPSRCPLGALWYFLRSAYPCKDSRSLTEATRRLHRKMGSFLGVGVGSLRALSTCQKSALIQLHRSTEQMLTQSRYKNTAFVCATITMATWLCSFYSDQKKKKQKNEQTLFWVWEFQTSVCNRHGVIINTQTLVFIFQSR